MSIERIIVGADGSEGSGLAVAWAAALGAQTGAEVVVVRAYNPLDELQRAQPPIDFGQLEQDAARRLAEEWCAPCTAAGARFRSRLIEDEPVNALVVAAREEHADLVVIGSHGQTGWRERVFGRVARGLPERAPCPVTIVPLRPAD
ncbi:MAG: universal stress protein [Acidimicrobiales bacterium]|jgi:nucleotide-binding universal stress UspA family protein|nr:universal stress protein [Acidimicrobiales bacterium]